MTGRGHVEHGIEPVFDKDSRVLMLGTMPSPKSREQGFYYGHPQNRFWRVMARVLGEEAPATVDDKKRMLLAHRIALWDVLASCDIEGASDTSITNAVPNDLSVVLDAAPIEAVLCTGAKAAQLYRKHLEPSCGIACIQLPSTSPANAQASLEALVDAYSNALAPWI